MAAPNRVVLVHDGKRIFDRTGVHVELVEQDDGDTLKVFVSDLPAAEKAESDEQHRHRFAESLRGLLRPK